MIKGVTVEAVDLIANNAQITIIVNDVQDRIGCLEACVLVLKDSMKVELIVYSVKRIANNVLMEPIVSCV